MKNLSLPSTKPSGSLLKKHHLTIFIIFIVAGLGYAVFSFTQLLSRPSSDSSSTPRLTAGSIDQATLDRLKALHTSNETIPPRATPPGRINPFTE
ncbi:MAG: hypothetical protein EOT05_00680 [Candidatus Microsaccharimonas sossegonensis]|uniref:Uncharacterized protein n=1 Tax=Candidatus Microsaccharimonas sossegonensis TaxID=2506948 RepID=A0A4V1J7D1_9BACT|nr:MAG: hypothetical protein EOT05_00680 [Candidatus Microsaccharimonas sossegonensis]